MVQNMESRPTACQALAQLGDAAAIIGRHAQEVCWTSAAWQSLPPQLAEARDLAELDGVLRGLKAALEQLGESPQRLCLGQGRRWQAELAVLDESRWLLRLTDRHEQGRAQQRQLDDREQLLFLSNTLSIGEMATTLAHELNQPIGATANLLRGLRARLCRRRSILGVEETDALERAIEQVMFAARVITRIREFTQCHQPRQEAIELAGLVRESVSLLDWDARRTGARVSLRLPDPPITVRGDRVMLQQVLVNLMRNAFDAMRGAPPADPHLQVSLVCSPREAVLRIRDNGCGLNEDAEARLFVPFASSKPTGMGIGLSICRSFVELHEGRLWFERNATGGATFHVALPLSATPLPQRLVEECAP
jgi:two-component system, LuxR family, sensor kinase FixL